MVEVLTGKRWWKCWKVIAVVELFKSVRTPPSDETSENSAAHKTLVGLLMRGDRTGMTTNGRQDLCCLRRWAGLMLLCLTRLR